MSTPSAPAEALTADTFMSAVESIRHGSVEDVTVAWPIRIARDRPDDHGRRTERTAADQGRTFTIVPKEYRT